MDIVCFSHLRWNFVYQRPQHILSRLKKYFRVFFVEEPMFDAETAFLDNTISREGVFVIVPHVSPNISDEARNEVIQDLLQLFFDNFDISEYVFWYYTPMALEIGESFSPELVIYDCMDELSAFKNAPHSLIAKEKALFNSADIVFTGGHSLYEAKKDMHSSIFPFPSSIEKKHFLKARTSSIEPDDQSAIPHPRIGFFGVVDERMDIDLLKTMAEQRPEWNFIIIGPVVKIDYASLPMLPNVFYLGSKEYKELPGYLAGWDVAMMPFAINESTKYISPTKTPEYLAGGKPVVSTPIQDVVNPYGIMGLVSIANNANEFVSSIENLLQLQEKEKWLTAVDEFLEQNSWDDTVEKMMFIINGKLESKQSIISPKQKKNYV